MHATNRAYIMRCKKKDIVKNKNNQTKAKKKKNIRGSQNQLLQRNPKQYACSKTNTLFPYERNIPIPNLETASCCGDTFLKHGS